MAAFFGDAFFVARLPFFGGDATTSSSVAVSAFSGEEAGAAAAFFALDFVALVLAGVAFFGDGDFLVAAFPPRLVFLNVGTTFL